MNFGDSVVYVKDGKPLNALVVKAQGDALNLIYLDPASESFVAQGNTSRLASTAVAVKPLADGAKFGWMQRDDSRLQHDNQLAKDRETAKSASFHVIEQPDGSFTSSVGPFPVPASEDDQKAAELAKTIQTNLKKPSFGERVLDGLGNAIGEAMDQR